MGNLLGLMSIATAVFFLVMSKKRSTEDERARQNKSAYSSVLYTSYNNNDGKIMKFKRINSENDFEEYMFFCHEHDLSNPSFGRLTSNGRRECIECKKINYQIRRESKISEL